VLWCRKVTRFFNVFDHSGKTVFDHSGRDRCFPGPPWKQVTVTPHVTQGRVSLWGVGLWVRPKRAQNGPRSQVWSEKQDPLQSCSECSSPAIISGIPPR